MRRFLTFAISLFLLSGCSDIASLLPTTEPATVPTNTSIPPTATATAVVPTNTPGGPRILRVWVPPQFNPSANTPAGTAFQNRLDAFVTEHPDVKIDVRVKAESGPSGLLDALTVTKPAAPSNMPDLVALSRPDLAAATAKGLLHPMDGLTDLPAASDWYPYARQMARIQNTTVGLPFAGDSLVLVGFRAPLLSTWSEIPDGTIFLFPAANPNALFTLSLYLSAGGTLQDNQGQISLDKTFLTQVLTLYMPTPDSNFISPQVVNYETYEQAWNAFHEQRGNLVVNWATRYLSEGNTQLALGPLPGLESGPYTLASGWSWALSGINPDNEALAVELAEFLSDGEFLGKWTQAAGYLPTRSTALDAWDDPKLQLTIKQITESAALVPSDDLVAKIGPMFSQAAISVLNGAQLPEEAASAVIEQLK